MGMYTGLRVKATIKPEYREEIGKILEDRDWENKWANSSIDFIQKFGKLYRSCMFPTGELSYMPESWGERYIWGSEDPYEVVAKIPLEIPRSYDEDTGYWTFSMSIKNYEDEIEYFLENVLGRIAESVDFCEYLYEVDEKSTFWVQKGNKMVPTDDGIDYWRGTDEDEE